MNSYENMYSHRDNVKKIYSEEIAIIEKATEKSWEELIK